MEEMEEKELPEEEPMMEPSSTDFIFFYFDLYLLHARSFGPN